MQATLTRPALYRYCLEFWQHKGQRLHEAALEAPDFAPAVEATFFDALRRGRFTEYALPRTGVRCQPRFANKADSPRVTAFTIVLPTPDGGEHTVEFSARFFHRHAQAIVAQLIANGQVAVDSLLLYQLTAYLDEGKQPIGSSNGMTLEEAEPVIPILPGSRRNLGPTISWDDPRPEAIPVLIPRRVLEDAVEEARQNPDREVGGVLLGHLRRDQDSNELFLEVTAHVPAEATQATSTSVTFTPETFAQVREVIEVRSDGEIIVGWVHSHPFPFCESCPIPASTECIAKVLFFSPDDHFLMSLAFPRPFMIGLQTAIEPRLKQALGHLPVRMYGWNNGEVVARGFEVIE